MHSASDRNAVSKYCGHTHTTYARARAYILILAMVVIAAVGEVACSSSVCRCALHGFLVLAGLVMVERRANKVYLPDGGDGSFLGEEESWARYTEMSS